MTLPRVFLTWACCCLGACYQSSGGSQYLPDYSVSPDSMGDQAGEVIADPLPDWIHEPSPPPDVDAGADPDMADDQDVSWDFPTESSTGTLVPEGEGILFETESGEYITSESCRGKRCAAFSGSIYEIIMQENTPWFEDSEFVGVYRLAPSGTVLGTSWIDTTPDISESGTQLCWTGEVFVAVLTTDDVGLRVVSVNEDGELVRPVEILETERGGMVFCPSDGPFIVEKASSWTEDDRIHLLNRDGTFENVQIDASTSFGDPCVEAGAEVACLNGLSISFIRREGTSRQSDMISGFEDYLFNRDIAYTGDGIALVWADYCDSYDDKCYMYYALWGMDGMVVVSPRPVARAQDHISIGISGSTVFVFGGGGYFDTPAKVLLLDMAGSLLDGPMPAASGYDICFWGALGVFWEGDAHALLWNTWPDEYILYRRFRVEE